MVDDTTIVELGILILGSNQQSSKGICAFEMYLYPFGLTNLFNLFFLYPVCRGHNGDVPIIVVVDCRAAAVIVVLARLAVSVELVLKLI